jgi:hypothetical protein
MPLPPQLYPRMADAHVTGFVGATALFLAENSDADAPCRALSEMLGSIALLAEKNEKRLRASIKPCGEPGCLCVPTRITALDVLVAHAKTLPKGADYRDEFGIKPRTQQS